MWGLYQLDPSFVSWTCCGHSRITVVFLRSGVVLALWPVVLICASALRAESFHWSFHPGPCFVSCLTRVPVSSKPARLYVVQPQDISSSILKYAPLYIIRNWGPIFSIRNHNPNNISSRNSSNYWRQYRAIALPAYTLENTVFWIINYLAGHNGVTTKLRVLLTLVCSEKAQQTWSRSRQRMQA